MIIDDAIRKDLIRSLKNDRKNYKNHFDTALDTIKEATTVEEIMEAKRTLLLDIIDEIPLNIQTCYFCIAHFPGCHYCDYGKKHGECNRSSSSYGNIQTNIEELRRALEEYYNGESYDN